MDFCDVWCEQEIHEVNDLDGAERKRCWIKQNGEGGR